MERPTLSKHGTCLRLTVQQGRGLVPWSSFSQRVEEWRHGGAEGRRRLVCARGFDPKNLSWEGTGTPGSHDAPRFQRMDSVRWISHRESNPNEVLGAPAGACAAAVEDFSCQARSSQTAALLFVVYGINCTDGRWIGCQLQLRCVQ